MAKYWSNFAHSGDPNQGVAVPAQWPAYSDADAILRFDVGDGGIAQQRGLRSEACDFMDGRLAAGRALTHRRAH